MITADWKSKKIISTGKKDVKKGIGSKKQDIYKPETMRKHKGRINKPAPKVGAGYVNLFLLR